MKNLLKVALVAFCVVFMGNFAKAQTKIGYIAMDQAIQGLPEVKTVQGQLEALNKQWQETLTTMQTKYQTDLKEYQAKSTTMTDAARTVKESELTDMQRRIQETGNSAQTAIDNKTTELSKPLIDKVRAAITAVAKEKGYTYVINSTQTELLVSPDADNLLAAVKLKLGLK
jgi:outer membrane protein